MILPFPEPLRALASPEHRWLMLGKGPSFARYAELGAGGRRICALNHVAAEVDCDVAHVADLDVIEDCGEAIAGRARFLLMPWRPHDVGFAPSPIPLEDLARTSPPLRRLAEAGRLLCYNLGSGHGMPAHPDAPWIETDLFGGPVAATALAAAGAREIRTLGVDGGTRYATAFERLADSTLLSNGAPSFDLQFRRFAALGRERGLVWGPLHAPMPIRVAILAPRGRRLAAALLAATLEDRASGRVAPRLVDPAQESDAPAALAAAAGEGRVLRLAPELLPLGDPLSLWSADMGGAPALTDPTGAVTLIDAGHAGWRAPGGEGTPTVALPPGTVAPPPEGRDAPAPALLDLRAAPLPWRTGGSAHTGGRLWRTELRRALITSRLPLDALRDALQIGEADHDLTSEFDPDLADPALLANAGAWRRRLRQGLRGRPAAPQPNGWRSWPGRGLRRAAQLMDAVLGDRPYRGGTAGRKGRSSQ